MKFKSDFLWGAATAAYQVEGGWLPYCLPGALSPETWRGSRACANYGLLPLVSYG